MIDTTDGERACAIEAEEARQEGTGPLLYFGFYHACTRWPDCTGLFFCRGYRHEKSSSVIGVCSIEHSDKTLDRTFDRTFDRMFDRMLDRMFDRMFCSMGLNQGSLQMSVPVFMPMFNQLRFRIHAYYDTPR